MRFTQAFIVAALPFLTNAAVLGNYKRDSALDVTLVAVDNAVVKATVKNVGSESLSLLAYGSLFDHAPVEKLNVFTQESTAVPFQGVLRSVQRTGLAEEHFVTLAAGETFETTINAAQVHDFKKGTGSYTFVAEGAIPYAKANSTELSGDALYFKSNVLEMKVNGDAAASVGKAIDKNKRAAVSQCTTTQKSQTLTALSQCVSLARAASTAASSGSASKFSEYFKTTSASTRSTVAARLAAVASECGKTTSGATTYYCSDVYGYCESNVLAYTLPSQNVVVNCPIYYSALPALTSTCHAQDRATTTLHEMTHAPGVYSPGTQDNGYGYSAATKLSTAKAVLNADSYALYANAIYVGC